jgi:hypothetical protein
MGDVSCLLFKFLTVSLVETLLRISSQEAQWFPTIQKHFLFPECIFFCGNNVFWFARLGETWVGNDVPSLVLFIVVHELFLVPRLRHG